MATKPPKGATGVIPYLCENCDSTDAKASARECALCEVAYLRDRLLGLYSYASTFVPAEIAVTPPAMLEAKEAINLHQDLVG